VRGGPGNVIQPGRAVVVPSSGGGGGGSPIAARDEGAIWAGPNNVMNMGTGTGTGMNPLWVGVRMG